ncbi:hypothetical protein JYT31_00830 [Beggiatoa alba]|nr:hypothetical protein [Beggiatoa alba]
MMKLLKSMIAVIFSLFFIIACSNDVALSDEVVIRKYVTHPALDATEEGIIFSISEAKRMGKISKHTEITTYNASANRETAKKLAEKILRNNPRVAIGIATPAAQALSRTPSGIPILYGAVSDPKGAGILSGGTATGIKNVGPHIIEKALKFIKTAYPDVKNIGTLFNPAEQTKGVKYHIHGL